MLSKIPNLNEKFGKDTDKEVLRVGIIAELDAINLYEQLAQATENKEIKNILLDIAKEEKTHVGEFQALLLKIDKEQVSELENGKKEVEEKSKK
jgi:rubrerythrin